MYKKLNKMCGGKSVASTNVLRITLAFKGKNEEVSVEPTDLTSRLFAAASILTGTGEEAIKLIFKGKQIRPDVLLSDTPLPVSYTHLTLPTLYSV